MRRHTTIGRVGRDPQGVPVITALYPPSGHTQPLACRNERRHRCQVIDLGSAAGKMLRRGPSVQGAEKEIVDGETARMEGDVANPQSPPGTLRPLKAVD